MKKTLYIFLSLIFFLSVSSCTDDFPLGDYEIGEGEAVLSATVNFHPLVGTKVDTGQGGRAAAGDALNDIDNITVFVYKEDGHLFDIYNGADLMDLKTMRKDTEGANTEMPSDAGEKAEETTSRATFTLKGIPFGKYNIYVTANIPFDKKQAKIDFENVKDLKKYTVEWNEKNIADNDQMFGYFSETGESDGFDAYPVVVNKKQMEIHAWIKRAASKVTVVFDGSGLHNGVFIYVKDVRIKDIPKYCRIGEDNRVWTEKGGQDSLINEGDVIYYNTDGLTETDPGEDYLKWLQINKGNGLRGAVSKDPETGVVTEHSEYDKALYFYENIQGNYPGQKEYCKHQDWDKVGYMPKPGEDDYKDNIPYGTYIEVEAYYVSENPENVSHGKIIYRFMLGQDVDYNYNAIRNHHYKLTLGFKGWANQPDWHIAYIEPPRTIFTDPTYYISYMYNQKAIFPIRILGDVQSLEVEIVENNWGPYDPNSPGNVPPAEVGTGVMDFKWNSKLYYNEGKENVTNALSYSGNVQTQGYYYGLQRPYNKNGTAQTSFTEAQIAKGAPRYVTPIWAGFLALNVPDQLEATLYPNDDFANSYAKLKTYFYNQKQNTRSFTEADLTFTGGQTEKTVGSGNNVCKITKAPDGSITVHFPMWTRPKSMLGGSGFTGNNPYDTYQRKAIVRIKATYPEKDGKKTEIEKFRPVFQVRRIVNPKAIWRKWDDTQDFYVKLVRREGASETEFKTFDSEGEWKAYVKTDPSGLVTLDGGNRTEGNAIIGNTGTPVEFTVKFNGTTGNSMLSRCAIVEVEYHGFTCYHSIFVRQGYNYPLNVAGDGVRWSSYALYKSKEPLPAFGTEWNENDKNYLEAELTANPLSLGTLFRRGNYNGVLIRNNMTYGVGVEPGVDGQFEMATGPKLAWKEIEGYPFTTNTSYDNVWGKTSFGATTPQETFRWGRFKINVLGTTRYYRVPTLQEYESLRSKCDFGIGVMYGDDAITTALTVDEAYGFEDFDNDGKDNKPGGGSSRGMRGVIVYNPSNANQVFFPVGARGVGRRTMDGEFNNTAKNYNRFGVLRYTRVEQPFDMSNPRDQYRPIPYNTAASPGALYWFNKVEGSSASWDCNYFDMNFQNFGVRVGFQPQYTTKEVTLKRGQTIADYNKTHGGDALPIKLVLDESASSN